MYILLAFLTGVLIGCAIMGFVSRKKTIGSLKIDRSDPDDVPYLFLELTKQINDFNGKKYISLKVDNSSYISYK